MSRPHHYEIFREKSTEKLEAKINDIIFNGWTGVDQAGGHMELYGYPFFDGKCFCQCAILIIDEHDLETMK